MAKPKPSPSVALADVDSDLVKAFHEKVLPSLVYIEHTCLKTGKTSAGTGTVIGYQGNKDDGWIPYVATAGHVIRNERRFESRFRLYRYSFDDLAHPTYRICEFETRTIDPRSPCGILYSGPHSDIVDIGFIRGTSECTDSKPFFDLDDKLIPVGGTMTIESDSYFAAEGTRVAWCGFAGIAAEIARRPQPCYFEGCVSALIATDGFVTYLVDGHNAFGVSGGPVWAQKSAAEPPRIIGIVSSYLSHERSPVPGFVRVVPIQPLRVFLEGVWGASPIRHK